MMKDSVGKDMYAPPASPALSGCLTNLKQLGLAMHMFAQDNGGKFPENTNILQEKRYVNPSSSILICPGNKNKTCTKTVIFM